MEIEIKPLQNTPIADATDNHDTQRMSSLAQPDDATPQGLEKIAASIELLRLEMQGIRLALEALVAKP
jgi:hypothetical protein